MDRVPFQERGHLILSADSGPLEQLEVGRRIISSAICGRFVLTRQFMRLQAAFIVSVPRSGSTVLTNLLDQHDDVICPPESFFPAVLDQLEDREMADKSGIAALFLASCSDGSPLTLEEAEQCVRPDKGETLEALALAIAEKCGRDPERIRTMVWKFTRMVGRWRLAAEIGGRFIVLRRNPFNVYESQFRVPFGAKNRNPLRFALFSASYDVAFRDYPADRVMSLDYPDIPLRMEEIVRWIGSSGERRRTTAGSLAATSAMNSWHANIGNPFENRDSEKILNLTPFQSTGLKAGQAVFKRLDFITRKARMIADRRQMTALRNQAAAMVGKN